MAQTSGQGSLCCTAQSPCIPGVEGLWGGTCLARRLLLLLHLALLPAAGAARGHPSRHPRLACALQKEAERAGWQLVARTPPAAVRQPAWTGAGAAAGLGPPGRPAKPPSEGPGSQQRTGFGAACPFPSSCLGAMPVLLSLSHRWTAASWSRKKGKGCVAGLGPGKVAGKVARRGGCAWTPAV